MAASSHQRAEALVPLDAPGTSTVEVVVFGRGVGEAILIHLGDAVWAAIDCVQAGDGRCAPLEYLRQIGVDPAFSLQYILATHWHDDHVRGISNLYANANAAEFFFSGALATDEFTAFIRANLGEDVGSVTNGVHEFHKCTQIYRAENKTRPVPNFVGNWSAIVDRPAISWSHGQRVELTALSPSPTDIFDFNADLARYQPAKVFAGEIPSPKRNDIAVATWLKVGELSVLFGSDLEEIANTARGWKQVVASSRQPSGSATLFKVPHHGSSTAYSADVIAKYLGAEHVSVLTPYTRSNLPRPTDVRRILSHSSEAYTARTKHVSRYRSSYFEVNELLKRSEASIMTLPKDVGIVRCRWEISRSTCWDVATYHGAAKLSKARL